MFTTFMVRDRIFTSLVVATFKFWTDDDEKYTSVALFMKMTVLPALKGINSWNKSKFRIKVGNRKIFILVAELLLKCTVCKVTYNWKNLL